MLIQLILWPYILGTSDFDHFLELKIISTGYLFIGSHIEGKIFFFFGFYYPNFCGKVLKNLVLMLLR